MPLRLRLLFRLIPCGSAVQSLILTSYETGDKHAAPLFQTVIRLMDEHKGKPHDHAFAHQAVCEAQPEGA